MWRIAKRSDGRNLGRRMSDKSEHKRAWQTAQRALQAARNAEAQAQLGRQPAPMGRLKKLSLIATIAGGLTTFAIGAYSFYPSIEIRAVDADTSANPLQARFSFRNGGRLSVSGAVVTCTLNTREQKQMVMSDNLADTGAGSTGQRFGRFDPSSPPIVRSCGTSGIYVGMTHPSNISIDVSWHFLPIGHQYFVSQQVADNSYRMVPESDPPKAVR